MARLDFSSLSFLLDSPTRSFPILEVSTLSFARGNKALKVYGTYFDTATSSRASITPPLNTPSIHTDFIIADDFSTYSEGLFSLANGGWSTDVGDTEATFMKTFDEPQDLYNMMGMSLWGKSDYDVCVKVAFRDNAGRISSVSNLGYLPIRWKRMDCSFGVTIPKEILTLIFKNYSYFYWPANYKDFWASTIVQDNHYPDIFKLRHYDEGGVWNEFTRDVSTPYQAPDDILITPGKYINIVFDTPFYMSSFMYGFPFETIDPHNITDLLFYIDSESLAEYYLDEMVVFGFEEENRNKTWVPLSITKLDTSLMGRTRVEEIAGGMGDVINQDRAQSRRGTMVFKTGHKEMDNDVRFVDKARRKHTKVFLRVGGEGWPLYLNDCTQVPEESIYGVRNEMKVNFIEAE